MSLFRGPLPPHAKTWVLGHCDGAPTMRSDLTRPEWRANVAVVNAYQLEQGLKREQNAVPRRASAASFLFACSGDSGEMSLLVHATKVVVTEECFPSPRPAF